MCTELENPPRNMSCFLCRTLLCEENVRKGWRNRKGSLEIFFKYLLQDKKKQNNDNLLESILHYAKVSGSSVRFCRKCESSIKRLSKLHLKLEITQMKLIDIVKCVRNSIILGSGKRDFPAGTLPDTKVDVELFRNFEEKEQSGFGSQDHSRVNEILESIQDEVVERSRLSHENVQVPFVYLQRCTNFKPIEVSNETKVNTSQEVAAGCYTTDNIVKIEPTTLDAEDFEVEDGDFPIFPEQHDDSLLMEPKPKLENHQKLVGLAKRQRRPKSLNSGAKRRKKTSKITVVTKERKLPRERAIFSCDSCPFQGKFERSRIEHHLRKHEMKEKFLKCPDCPMHEGFSGIQLYNLHLSYHTETNRCTHCQEKIIYFDLADHYRAHGVTVYQCPACRLCFTTQEKFLKHSQRYGAEANTYGCHICTDKFSSRRYLLSHLYEVHAAISKLTCDYEGCGKEFLNPSLLSVHKTKTHKNSATICQECGKVFKCETNFQRHRMIHGEKQIACDQCPEKFMTKLALERHRIRDHGAPKYQCDKCDKTYTTVLALREHVESIHEGVRYPCSICNETFDNKVKMKRHKHRLHKPPEKLTCTVCAKEFATRQTMTNHMKIHGTVKEFKCTYCPKAFFLSKCLTLHLRIHTGEKPYVCDICGRAFNQLTSLKVHKKSQHRN